MDTTIHERLIDARTRLRSAAESGLVPVWLSETAQQCLIDLDCALSGGLSPSQARMLLAQVDALVSVLGDQNGPRARRDADSQ